MKKILITLFIVFSFINFNIHKSFANDDGFLGEKKIHKELKGSDKTLSLTVRDYIVYLLSFLAFVAVVYGLWGGFNILTAAGDEEKVKKGKTIIIQGIIGIIVIFLAGPIASFFLGGSKDKSGKPVPGLLEKK